MRFRPEQHLRRQSDFRAVREQGRRINCGAFTLLCLRRAAPAKPDPATTPAAPSFVTAERYPPGNSPRVGVVASISAVGHAVLRNRAKRRLREVFRRHQSSIPEGCDLILTARTAATLWPIAELEQKFVEACRQLESTHRG
jgi:ribonuclease P protein component